MDVYAQRVLNHGTIASIASRALKVLRWNDWCVLHVHSFDRLHHWAADDKAFVLELLHESVLLVHGSGFSPELGKGHVRLVYLADTDVLDVAFD